MHVYMMRHGQTVSNTKKIFLGRRDEGLSAIGVRQARLAAQPAMECRPEAIYCSPLRRAKQTAMIINLRHVPIIEDETIRERDLGSLTGMPYADVDWSKLWELGNYASALGVEPLEHMIRRVGDFLDDIAHYSRCRSVIVVTHEGVLKSAFAHFNGMPKSGSLADVITHNTSITRYEC